MRPSRFFSAILRSIEDSATRGVLAAAAEDFLCNVARKCGIGFGVFVLVEPALDPGFFYHAMPVRTYKDDGFIHTVVRGARPG